MTIPELQEKLGVTRAELAKIAGVSYEQLANAASKKAEVTELKNGDFALLNKRTTIFKLSEVMKTRVVLHTSDS